MEATTMADRTKATIRRHRRQLLNVFFGFLAVAGQVGQNVSLPLWIDAGRPELCDLVDIRNSTEESNFKTNFTDNCQPARSIDSYFVYTFACICFVIIFGVMLPLQQLLLPGSCGETERRFPQLALFLIGFCDALNGVLVVFASSGKRTLPALQPILGNFMIPLTVLCRLLLLQKRPSLLKAGCAAAVFLALIVSLVPTFVPSLGGDLSGGASGIGRFLWPMIFMLGFVPAAVMNVLQEKWLKHQLEPLQNADSSSSPNSNQLNLIFFLFCTSCYQLLTAAALFWVDIVPGYGNASDLQELTNSWSFGISCFFGGDGCSAETGMRGASFIGMYTVSYIGGGLLLRYAEGATFLAIVNALVTPLGFLFWTFFSEDPFYFRVELGPTTWFSMGSLILMVPAILAYNLRSEMPDPETQRLINQSDHHDHHHQNHHQNAHSHHDSDVDAVMKYF